MSRRKLQLLPILIEDEAGDGPATSQQVGQGWSHPDLENPWTAYETGSWTEHSLLEEAWGRVAPDHPGFGLQRSYKA